MSPTVRAAANWVFRDRTTGNLVIGQRPNLVLTLWLVCTVTRWLFHPHGRWATFLDVLGSVALLIWAADEVARGVNPWRRILGASVLVAVLLGWALSR